MISGKVHALAALLVILSACTVNLAPPYDPSLVSGLNQANEKTMVLFSSLANGSTAAAFQRSSNSYDDIIGKFGALKLQAEARDVPLLATKIAHQLRQSGVLDAVCSDATACVNSSPNSIKAIIDNLSKMKNVHEANGVSGEIVAIFKSAHEISMSQALTVETALKRE